MAPAGGGGYSVETSATATSGAKGQSGASSGGNRVTYRSGGDIDGVNTQTMLIIGAIALVVLLVLKKL